MDMPSFPSVGCVRLYGHVSFFSFASDMSSLSKFGSPELNRDRVIWDSFKKITLVTVICPPLIRTLPLLGLRISSGKNLRMHCVCERGTWQSSIYPAHQGVPDHHFKGYPFGHREGKPLKDVRAIMKETSMHEVGQGCDFRGGISSWILNSDLPFITELATDRLDRTFLATKPA